MLVLPHNVSKNNLKIINKKTSTILFYLLFFFWFYFALHFKGDAFLKQNKYQDALDCYNMALQINPNYTPLLGTRELALKYLNKSKKGFFGFLR